MPATLTSLTLTSPAFSEGAVIPAEFSCDGANRSPELRWSEGPPGTQSFALIVHDPDAPRGDFTHWVLFDIPGDTRSIPAGGPAPGTSGRNDFGKTGYGGPCPPPGHGSHRYLFQLYALDTGSLGLSHGTARADVERAMQGHIMAEGRLMGTYARTGGG